MRPIPVLLLSGLLAGCAGGAKSVPALVKALHNSDPEVRADAARRLGQMGDQAKPAIPALAGALRDRQVSVFRAAGDAMVALGEESRPFLSAMAREPSAWLRCRAVETMGRLRPSPDSVPLFLSALEDHDQCVHEKAVDALARAGDPAVPGLVGLLKSPNPTIRRAASEALTRMPSEARERAAFPLVLQLQGKDDYLRGEAELLLSEMGQPAVPSLLPLLEEKDADLRRRVVVILGRVGVAGDDVVSALARRLTDEDRLVCLKAAMTLGQLGEQDPKVLPALLLKLSVAKEPELRRGLVAAVGNMGLSAREAVDVLMRLMNDEDKEVREEASESLMKIGTTQAMDAVERRNRESLKK